MNRRPTIRQNPPTSTGRSFGAYCLIHGGYDPPPRAAECKRQALSPGVRVDHARALLDQAAQLTRMCPECQGMAPTAQQWCSGIRQRVTGGIR